MQALEAKIDQLTVSNTQLQAQFSQFLAAQSQAQQEKGRFPTQGTNASAHFVYQYLLRWT